MSLKTLVLNTEGHGAIHSKNWHICLITMISPLPNLLWTHIFSWLAEENLYITAVTVCACFRSTVYPLCILFLLNKILILSLEVSLKSQWTLFTIFIHVIISTIHFMLLPFHIKTTLLILIWNIMTFACFLNIFWSFDDFIVHQWAETYCILPRTA